jgi:site-specific DNA-methyltransferase (adenine-specific)
VAAVPNEVFEDFRATTRTPKRERLLRVAREAKAAERRAEPSEPSTRTDDIEIRHGDLRTALDDLAGTVDAIITDPPYPAEFLGEFDALGDLAARLLAPCGVLVAMVGQSHLPEYMARLGAHLTYRWTAAYMVDGPAARIHQRMVGTKWKPLLVYDRGAERSFIAQDVFRSSADDKEHHGWGQSESGMSDIVSRLTFPGSLVVDPFLGGGTTALVCRDLGRRFVGCDIDADAVATTRERLA